MTKSEEVFTKVEQLIASGTKKADAFKALAAEYGQPVNSVRGAYYQWTTRTEGTEPRRTRRRSTTPDDAVADARRALERAIAAIDAEVVAAQTRATEAKAEAEDLKSTATARKDAIRTRLDALA